MGQCDYEKGDDGRMLSTVLDSSIFKCEHVEGQWSIEGILDKIAMHDPPFHTLIDTGALITGFSNKAVARELLARGLPNCDGVVFLDDEDRQKVLVRATGRVVNADQCGIPLTRRFAFYDQIHTTGMDIKHRVNAHAVVTLGKDMVFRDYVQGAYRMRGIGIGQTCTVLIIPEVRELVGRELRQAQVPNATLGVGDIMEHALVKIVAWLLINSMRSEQIQWTMLCIQNVANLYRKIAFRSLMVVTKRRRLLLNKDEREDEDIAASHASIATLAPENNEEADMSATDHSTIAADLAVFNEKIDFKLEEAVPDPVPFTEKLSHMLDSHRAHLGADCTATAEQILDEVGKFIRLDGRAINLDTEQEREQEQEQQKEVQAKRDQQVEVEKFVDREYTRSQENAESWPVSVLADAPTTEKHPFYPLSKLKLRHQDTLDYPPYLLASSNYFNRKWSGLRRLKNVVMVLEWLPSLQHVRPLLLEPEAARSPPLTAAQQENLRKAYRLLSFRGKTTLKSSDVANAVEMATFKPVDADTVNFLMRTFGSDDNCISVAAFESMLRSGHVHDIHSQRYWVAVSLAEAETLRRLLHVRNAQSIVRGHDVAIALRYSPATSPALMRHRNQNPAVSPAKGSQKHSLTLDPFCGVLLDASAAWASRNGLPPVPVYQQASVHAAMRFFDCDTHFSPPATNTLIRLLESSKPYKREKVFNAVIGCRRRMRPNKGNAQLAAVFSVEDSWRALKQRAQISHLQEAFLSRGLSLYEAFMVIDANTNGSLDPAELYGAVEHFNIPCVGPEDLVDLFESADQDGDGNIDYQEWLALFGSDDEAKAVAAEDNSNDTQQDDIVKVTPKDAVVLRKIVVRRRQHRLQQQREDRLKQEAYAAELERVIYRDELVAASERFKSGSNPRPINVTCAGSTCRVLLFWFNENNRFPLRMTQVPPSSKLEFEDLVPPTAEERKAMEPLKCQKGHQITLRPNGTISTWCNLERSQLPSSYSYV